MLYVLCTSKPSDGLLHYSYEYTHKLNEAGMETKCLFFPSEGFTKQDYIDAINNKYRVYDHVMFDDEIVTVWDHDGCFILNRSMITLPYHNRNKYTEKQRFILSELCNKLISTYSTNHPEQAYQAALMYFNANYVVDICDKEVYNDGVGENFEKRINFSLYKDIVHEPVCEHLFLGTNREYYDTVLRHYENYADPAVIVYENQKGLEVFRHDLKHIYVPVDNLCGLFEKYVYTKTAFDPAPRLLQECKYYGKELIYARDPSMVDGGSVYYKRDLKEPDLTAVFNAIDILKRK